MSTYGQTITVTGTVKNDKGEILAAATVAEKGVTNSTLSDADGNFQIQVRPNAVITVSYKGLKTREFRMSDRDTRFIAELPTRWKKTEFGFSLGGNYCYDAYFKIKNSVNPLPTASYVKPYIGGMAGISASCIFTKNFSGEFGFMFNLRGIKEEEGNYKGVTNLYDITVPFPFLAKFKVNIGESNIYFITGTQVNMLLSGKTKETFGKNERTWNLMNSFSPVMPGATGGIGFESKIGLGLQLSYDLSGQLKDKNYYLLHTFQGSLIYRITKRN